MMLFRKLPLFFLIPVLFLLVQGGSGCNSSTQPDVGSAHDISDSSSHGPDDTSRLVGVSAGDAAVTAIVANALVFHINDTMRTSRGYKATLALGKDQVLEDLKKEVQQSGDVSEKELFVDTTLKIAAQMRARLKDLSPEDNRSFEISSMNEENDIQDITEETGNRAFWQWKVIPLKEGRHELELVVEIVLNRKKNIFLPSKTIPIVIYSPPESMGKTFSVFFGKNWQWMLTAIIVPVFIAWFTTRRKQMPAPPAQTTGRKRNRKH